MFKQKYEKSILMFLPFSNQNDQQKSVHQEKQQKSNEENYIYHEYSSSEQCFTPNYNQVEEQQPIQTVNDIALENDHEEKQNQTFDKKYTEKEGKQRQILDKDQVQKQHDEQSQSRIDYSLYERLRGGNAIQYANLIYVNDEPHSQQNCVQDYRDSGISFLESQLILPHTQSRVKTQIQAHNQYRANQPLKNSKNIKNKSAQIPLQPIYQSFYIQGQPQNQKNQQDILLKWDLISQFLRYEYVKCSNDKNHQNDNIQKMQNYRGSWPGKNLLSIDKFDKKYNKMLSSQSDVNKIPIQIARQIEKLQQMIEPFKATEITCEKMFQKQINSIAQKLSKNQQLNLERLKKQNCLIQKYKFFLLKVRQEYQKRLQKSWKQSQVVTTKRLQKVSTQLIRTKRIIKKEVLSKYDEFFVHIKQIKKQIESQSRKHKQQLDEIEYAFQNEIMKAYQSLKQVQKQIKNKKSILQEKIQNTGERLNKILKSEICQNQQMTSNIKTLMIDLLNQIEQSQSQ